MELPQPHQSINTASLINQRCFIDNASFIRASREFPNQKRKTENEISREIRDGKTRRFRARSARLDTPIGLAAAAPPFGKACVADRPARQMRPAFLVVLRHPWLRPVATLAACLRVISVRSSPPGRAPSVARRASLGSAIRGLLAAVAASRHGQPAPLAQPGPLLPPPILGSGRGRGWLGSSLPGSGSAPRRESGKRKGVTSSRPQSPCGANRQCSNSPGVTQSSFPLGKDPVMFR